MNNAAFTFHAIQQDIQLTTSEFLRHEIVWGFLLGITAATIIYAFLVSEHPRNIPTMLTCDLSDSFTRVAERDMNGRFMHSYTSFTREYRFLRITFYAVVLLILVVGIIALFRVNVDSV